MIVEVREFVNNGFVDLVLLFDGEAFCFIDEIPLVDCWILIKAVEVVAAL